MNNEQLVLLDEAVAPIARRTDPATSRIAAATMREGARLQRELILTALERRGFQGGVYTEIASDTGLEPVAVDRRYSELRRLVLAVRLAETRRTPSGRPAHVHVAIAFRAGRETA